MFCVAPLIADAALEVVRAEGRKSPAQEIEFWGELSAQLGQKRRRRGLIS